MGNELKKAMERLESKVKSRALDSLKPSAAVPMQLPLWENRLRGLPNAMARSALFTCANHRSPREDYKRHLVASLGNYEIYYTGVELRQDDEDVFLQIVHLARTTPLGDVVEVSGNQLLRVLGWNNSSRDYDRLRSSIERLKDGTVRIANKDGTAGYAGSLIRKYAYQGLGDSDHRTKWQIFLEREIANLFGDKTYSLTGWDERLRLKPLSKWLHSFYHTHEAPFPYSTEKLMVLSGSKSSDVRYFRRDLKAALDELVVCGFLSSWKHRKENDVFEVVRNQGRLARQNR